VAVCELLFLFTVSDLKMLKCCPTLEPNDNDKLFVHHSAVYIWYAIYSRADVTVKQEQM